MEIQQHDDVVVEVAAISAGLRQAQRGGGVLQREREAPGAGVRSPPYPLMDQEGGDVYPNRTCVEHGGAFRSALGSSVIWVTTSTTPSTPFT